MDDPEKPQYKFWNGKNPDGKSYVGSPHLISERPRKSKTAAKYEIGNEAVAADNLQKNPQ